MQVLDFRSSHVAQNLLSRTSKCSREMGEKIKISDSDLIVHANRVLVTEYLEPTQSQNNWQIFHIARNQK